MQTARRLYVYLLSAISLGVLVAGVSMALEVLLRQMGLDARLGDRETGEQLTLAAALTAVALPVWLIHWFLAERSVRPDQSNAALERSSAVRGLYFALAPGVLLAVSALGVADVVRAVVERSTGGDVVLAGSLARAVVAGVAWAYHAWVRARDWTRGPITGPGAWIPRAYRYVAALVGLLALLSAVTDLLDLGGRWAFTTAPSFDANWWTAPAGTALGGVVAGGAVWLIHAGESDRLRRDSGWRGSSERPARLRQAYFVAVMVAGAAAAISGAGRGLGQALAELTGSSAVIEPGESGVLIVAPLLGAVLFAIAVWLHARRLAAEATESRSSRRMEAASRLALYPLGLVGLAFGALAVAQALGTAIDGIFGTPADSGWWRDALAEHLPNAVLGWALWAWAWRRIGARRAADPAAEAASTTRRASLLIAIAVAVLGAIAAASVVLYRLFGSLFGVSQSGDPVADIATSVSGLAVALAVAGYHLVVLRADQRLRGTDEPVAEGQPTVALDFRLSGPSDADLIGAVAAMRAQLPEEFDLDLLDGPAESGGPALVEDGLGAR